MNKFDTTQSGGHPLTLNDFDFIQKSWIEGFKCLSNILQLPSDEGLEPSYIIAGCEKTNPSAGLWQISEGFVVVKGELCYVPQHNVSFSNINDPLYWLVEQTIVEPSPVQYKDFNVKDVHLQRVAKATTTTTDVLYNPEQNVKNRLDKIQRGQSGSLTLLNGWSGSIDYRVKHGMVFLYGEIICESNTIQSETVCLIPSEIAPFYRGFGYIGTSQAVSEAVATAIGFGAALYGGHTHQSTRIFRNDSGTLISTSGWPLTIFPDNLNLPAPRTPRLFVLNPQNIPSGYNSVSYNLNGICWEIAPRI